MSRNSRVSRAWSLRVAALAPVDGDGAWVEGVLGGDGIEVTDDVELDPSSRLEGEPADLESVGRPARPVPLGFLAGLRRRSGASVAPPARVRSAPRARPRPANWSARWPSRSRTEELPLPRALSTRSRPLPSSLLLRCVMNAPDVTLVFRIVLHDRLASPLADYVPADSYRVSSSAGHEKMLWHRRFEDCGQPLRHFRGLRNAGGFEELSSGRVTAETI